MNIRDEFSKAPIQTTAAALAIAIAVGGIFAGGLTLALPSIRVASAAWFPIYVVGCAIGIGAGLLAAASFRRTWIFGVGVSIGLLFASANISARVVGFSNLELNAVEIFWNGALCYIGFAGVLAERAYLAAKNGGAFDGEDSIDQMFRSGGAHMIAYAVGFPGAVFAAIYAGSLPNALAALLN